jgi:hypothetical protein
MLQKIKNGWKLAKDCWRVLQLDRELLVFPFLSLIALLLVLASFVVPFWSSGEFEAFAEGQTEMSEPVMFAVFFAFYFAASFVIFFFNSALIACAIIRFRGGDPTVADGLRAATQRLPRILAWSFVSACVGVILGQIEERSGAVGKFIVKLIGAGWAIASYFAVPVFITEDLGPIDTLKKSASMIKKTWGETLTAEVGMSLLVIAAIFPGMALIAVGAFSLEVIPLLGGLLIALGILGIFGVILAGFTLDGILTSALYLYATDGKVPHNFDNQLATNAFSPKQSS